MKKKGLIVATIVMVLVLAVSLTTATYAWFTAASTTSIQGFSVSVASDNNVNIGFLGSYDNVMSENPVDTQYYTGDVVFTRGANDGVLGGSWTSETNGLSATVNHDILWGAQIKAVSIEHSATTISTASASTSSYTESIAAALAKVEAETTGYDYYSINAANAGTTSTTLANVAKAQANYKNKSGSTDAERNGDYVHIVLGAQPNKTLTTNELVVAVDYSEQTGANLGVLTAIHIAYRVCKNGGTPTAWTDVELFGTSNHYTKKSNGDGSQGGVSTNITGAYATAYKNTYGGDSVPAKTYMASAINNLSLTAGAIDQIELVIYIDGIDDDCNNGAINNIKGALKIFFNTAVAAPVTP